jgi:hypothetical protein
MRLECVTRVHAPNKTPSVPTFMPHLSCHTVNCLNWKYELDIAFNNLYVLQN